MRSCGSLGKAEKTWVLKKHLFTLPRAEKKGDDKKKPANPKYIPRQCLHELC